MALIATIACRSEKAAPNVLAKVDDHIITANDYRRKLMELNHGGAPEPVDVTIRNKILNDMIERELLIDEAERRNIVISPGELQSEIQRITENYPGKEFDKMLASKHLSAGEWREDLQRSLLHKKAFQRITDESVIIADPEVKQYYDTHLENYQVPEKVRALHVHVDSEQDAFNVLAQLRKGTPFETLAREHSLGPEAQSGGDLGYFSKGVMPEIFDEAIFPLEVGKISRVVSSEYGYHIFKLADRRPAHTRSFEESKEEIRAQLANDQKQKIYSKWLETRIKKARIMKNKELLAKLNF